MGATCVPIALELGKVAFMFELQAGVSLIEGIKGAAGGAHLNVT